MIGWENNQGAYFIQKLNEKIDNTISDVSDLSDGLENLDDVVEGNTTDIGDLSDLTTTEKSSLVSAVNEINEILPTKLTDGTLLKAVSEEGQLSQGLYCIAKGTLTNAGSLSFETTSNRYVALILITGNDGKLAIYYAGFKNGSKNETAKIAGTTYDSISCSATGTISVSVAGWTTVTIIATAQMS